MNDSREKGGTGGHLHAAFAVARSEQSRFGLSIRDVVVALKRDDVTVQLARSPAHAAERCIPPPPPSVYTFEFRGIRAIARLTVSGNPLR